VTSSPPLGRNAEIYTFDKMTSNSTKAKRPRSPLRVRALGVFLLLNGCSTAPHTYVVAGSSMLPLFHSGDRIFVNESDQARSDLHDGDIIVLRHNDTIILKRIVAMPGETIGGDNRKVFRNGKQLDEPYLAPATGHAIPAQITFATRTVGPGELFVMGDNRDMSSDSRLAKYGAVHISDVVGKYSWTYWHARSAIK
jgi:signal peptidase I